MEEKKFVESILDRPYNFKVKVEDNSCLPEELKDKKELSFELRSPTMGVLFQISKIFLSIPEKDTKYLEDKMSFINSLDFITKYIDNFLEVIAVLIHGKENDYPYWYTKFLRSNLTKKEVIELFTESLSRIDTSFFLSSLKGIKSMSIMQKNITH